MSRWCGGSSTQERVKLEVGAASGIVGKRRPKALQLLWAFFVCGGDGLGHSGFQ
uniref:Uncharacterized protein n=1 Tax=Arundo donax TaxID=35708 RepID=A0A0A9AMU9_ARUDO